MGPSISLGRSKIMYVVLSDRGADSTDAANDCYAGWKVFQILEAFRVVEGYEMPMLIDYGDEVDKKNRKRRVRLLESMRNVRAEGGRCLALLNELISIKRTRLSVSMRNNPN
jgi:hypothetical protein